MTAFVTSVADAFGAAAHASAATAAACGVAMEVPLSRSHVSKPKPNVTCAAGEFFRVLKPGGRLGISDLTKMAGPLPELDGLLSWIACIGDAQPVESYARALRQAGLTIESIEDHSYALNEMVRQIQGKLLGAEIAVGLKKFEFPNVNFSDAKRFAQAAASAVKDGKLGYAVIGALQAPLIAPIC